MDKFKTRVRALAKKKLKSIQKHIPSPTKPRLAICSGMHRSGSTFTYNICYALGMTPLGSSDPILDRSMYRTGVMKTHFLNYDSMPHTEDIKIISSYRDVRDTYISLLFIGTSHAKAIRNIHLDIESIRSMIGKKNTLNLRYERDIFPSEGRTITKIAKFLNIRKYDTDNVIKMVGIEKIKKIQEVNMRERPAFCHKLLCEKHVSKTNGRPGSYKRLDKNTLGLLYKEFSDYLEEFNYIGHSI